MSLKQSTGSVTWASTERKLHRNSHHRVKRGNILPVWNEYSNKIYSVLYYLRLRQTFTIHNKTSDWHVLNYSRMEPVVKNGRESERTREFMRLPFILWRVYYVKNCNRSMTILNFTPPDPNFRKKDPPSLTPRFSYRESGPRRLKETFLGLSFMKSEASEIWQRQHRNRKKSRKLFTFFVKKRVLVGFVRWPV